MTTIDPQALLALASPYADMRGAVGDLARGALALLSAPLGAPDDAELLVMVHQALADHARACVMTSLPPSRDAILAVGCRSLFGRVARAETEVAAAHAEQARDEAKHTDLRNGLRAQVRDQAAANAKLITDLALMREALANACDLATEHLHGNPHVAARDLARIAQFRLVGERAAKP